MTAPLPPGLSAAPLVSHWFVPVADGRLRVRTGRAELGQGNHTALRQMAAETLGLCPDRLGLTGPDTGRSPDEGFTAGSLSISQGGAAIRAAARALRALVLAEAARRLNAETDTLGIAGGAIVLDGAETGLTLTGLATEIDLDRPVADIAGASPPPRPGGAVPRFDLRERMTGAPFVHDLAPEGLLHGRVILPPDLDTPLPDDLDLDALRGRPGIVAVVRDGRFLGLVAETEAEAREAGRWIEARLTWPAARETGTDIQAMLEEAEAETEILQDANLPDGPPTAEVTAARPFLSHGAMGPSAALATWEDGRLTVCSHSQGVYPLRAALAQVLDLPPDAVRVIHVPGPGCYGHNGADDVALDAALLARACPGRPVRLIWTRAQEFGAAPAGAAMRTRVRAWVRDGRIAALETRVISPPHAMRPGMAGAPCLRSGHLLDAAHPLPVPPDLPAARGGGAARNALPIYAAPARVSRKLVTRLPWRTSSLRALGAHLNVYAIETAVDAALAAEGIDPFAGRRASLDDPRATAVLDRLEEMSEDIRRDGAEDRSWGIALARYKNTAAWAAVLAEVELGDTVRVPRVRAAVDMGEVINPDGARNQIEGGIVQALSWTLKEALTLDGPRIGTAGWEDYPILRFSEVPRIEVALIDRPEAPPLGCAEAVQGPAAAALGNAVQRLVGVPVPTLPLTREAVIAAVSA